MKNLYLFYGEEPLIIKNKINNTIKQIPTSEYSITTYDYEETRIFDIIQDASMPPFLVDYKVIVIKNPHFFENQEMLSDQELNSLKRYLNNPYESTILIFDAANVKVDKKSTIFKIFMKVGEVSQTEELTSVELTGWLRRQLQTHNITIKDDAIKLFFNIVSRDLFAAQNEINKLINYVGPGGVITTQIINDVVTKEPEKDVFSLTNAIIEEDKQKVINIYQRLIKDGNSPSYLFSLIAKTLRELIIVQAMLEEGYKQGEIAEAMNYSSGRAYYAVKNARSIKPQVVQEYIERLGNLDYKIKSGQIDINTGLEFLIFGL